MLVVLSILINAGNYISEKFNRNEFLNHNQLLNEKRKAIEANLAKQQFIRYIFHEVFIYNLYRFVYLYQMYILVSKNYHQIIHQNQKKVQTH